MIIIIIIIIVVIIIMTILIVMMTIFQTLGGVVILTMAGSGVRDLCLMSLINQLEASKMTGKMVFFLGQPFTVCPCLIMSFNGKFVWAGFWTPCISCRLATLNNKNWFKVGLMSKGG